MNVNNWCRPEGSDTHITKRGLTFLPLWYHNRSILVLLWLKPERLFTWKRHIITISQNLLLHRMYKIIHVHLDINSFRIIEKWLVQLNWKEKPVHWKLPFSLLFSPRYEAYLNMFYPWTVILLLPLTAMLIIQVHGIVIHSVTAFVFCHRRSK